MPHPFFIIDSHCHVHFNAYKDDMDEVIKRSLAENVFMVTVGTQTNTSQKAVETAEKYDGVWAAIGLHPCHTQEQQLDPEEIGGEEVIHTRSEEFAPDFYRRLAQSKKVVAVGEIGLDYHHFEVGDEVAVLKEKQKKEFIQALEFANEVSLPVMIHCWDAYDDLLEILKSYPVKKLGVVHSFVGGHKTAKKFIERGYKIGLNGIITYTESYDRLIRELNLDDILLETDAPYLAPPPYRGQRNEPYYVIEVAKKIAGIKGCDLDEVIKTTTDNTKKLLGLDF